MLRLILAFVDIALHRRGPDQLPSSRFFFGALLAIAWLLEVAMLRMAGLTGIGRPLLLATLFMACDLAFLWVVLRAFGRARRYRQTATAVLGIDVPLLIFALLLITWHNALAAPPTETTLPGVLALLTNIWSIDITSFILSRAIERPYFLCLAIMLGYLLFSFSVRQLFVPVQFGAT